MQTFDYLERLKNIKSKLSDILVTFNMEKLTTEIKELEQQQASPDFFKDAGKAKEVNKKKKTAEKQLETIRNSIVLIKDIDAYTSLMEQNTDKKEEENFKKEFDEAEIKINQVWLNTLLSSEVDNSAAIVSLHAGAGGEEAQDWAEMLARMYERYAGDMGFTILVLDETAGEGAGVKSRTYLIDGENAYGYLKAEKGVHRLVRLSPFDSNNRRHTSFASVEVSPFIEKPSQIEINPGDIRIDTYRSGGAGGQHVNKTESAVRITHLKTGIVAQCQNERSQIQNKEIAMKMLYGKLHERAEREEQEKKDAELGKNKKIEWGSQIRSYVLYPYNLVKDHRTNLETSDTTGVLDGKIQPFINAYLVHYSYILK